MTLQQAQEIKNVLLQVRDSIPASLVDPIYNYYKTFIDPGYVKPCTCQPKYWNQMLIGLRDKVESILSNQVISNEETINVPSQEKKRGRRSVLSGATK